jgi:NADP-dependent 3-hydroxy acid dehydrogenase YdfG
VNKIYKSALITGAANGIGYSILKRLVSEKIDVTAVDKDERQLKKISKEFNINTIKLDLTNTKLLYKKLSSVKTDILINNAGIGRGVEGLLNSSPNDIKISSRINVEAHLHVIKAIVPGMVKRRKGHVVLMGSLAGLYPVDSAIYGGQKGAVHRIAQSLRVELSGTRVKVTEICPGRTKTNFGNAAFDDKNKAKKFMSGFTLLEARDITDAILFALSTRWRSNISTIEISGTEQSPGGVPIYPVKDPILS